MTTANTAKTLQMEPVEAMLQMMSGLWISRGIYVAAKLGISDLLVEGAKTADQLAAETGTHADSLYRVLRMLATAQIYSESEDRKFSLTPLSDTLRSDVVGTLRPVSCSAKSSPCAMRSLAQ